MVRNGLRGNVLWHKYVAHETIAQYNYMTINAFNLYGIFGQNWTALSVGTSVLGYALMLAVVVFSGFVFFKRKTNARYYITAFILVFGIYMLAPKMHERYAFPGIFVLIMLLSAFPTNKNFGLYGLFSLLQFFNIAWVLFVYETDPGKYFKSTTISVASVINLVMFGWAVYEAYKK